MMIGARFLSGPGCPPPDPLPKGEGTGARVARLAAAAAAMPGRLHRDQGGTITILTVFGALLLAMLLGMVMNVGRQIDGKIRMQNAADAAAYSGGVVIARGMNTLAFSNHLLCEVFAITAFLREADEGNAESYVPQILDAWREAGGVFRNWQAFPKFGRMGEAIPMKADMEQQMVAAWCDVGRAAASQFRPVMEQILQQELIPQYERAVVEAFPDIAQMTANEIARRNGQPELGRGPMRAALWRINGQVVGGTGEGYDRTLPAVDPVMDSMPNQQQYLETARRQRRTLANHYLNEWNRRALYYMEQNQGPYTTSMSQFHVLWRTFTCGQLERLLAEHPMSNLPMVIRARPDQVANTNAFLEANHTFVAVAYWDKLRSGMFPGIFRNVMDSDAVTFAQVRVYLPTRRLVWRHVRHTPGDEYYWTWADGPVRGVRPPEDDGAAYWVVGRQGVPTHWDLLNQHWSCQLVPAVGPNLDLILQSVPPLPGFEDVEAPRLGPLRNDDLVNISTH
jgi:hypothetical protein